LPGSLSDINVLHRTHLLADLTTTKWMAMNIRLDIILPMVYIRLGKHFWRPFKSPKQRNKLNLRKHKKHAERILKELLVLCKLGLPFFVV
jgi:hypothetical protein